MLIHVCWGCSGSNIFSKIEATPHIFAKIEAIPHIFSKIEATPHIFGKIEAVPHIFARIEAMPHIFSKIEATPHIFKLQKGRASAKTKQNNTLSISKRTPFKIQNKTNKTHKM